MAYGMGPERESKLDPITCYTPLAISSFPQRFDRLTVLSVVE
jgi:hypothetical protein